MWDYSVAVDVQGFIVEAVTGKSLSAFLEERIWKPLDMADTSFSVPEAKRARYALAFANDPVSGKPQSIPHASGKPIKFDCGGGCAVSTALDYLRFAQMLVNGGTLDGKRLLSRKTIELMASDQLGPDVRGRTTNGILNEGYSSVWASLSARRRVLPRLPARRRLQLGRRLRHLLLDRSQGGDGGRLHGRCAWRGPRTAAHVGAQHGAAVDRRLGLSFYYRSIAKWVNGFHSGRSETSRASARQTLAPGLGEPWHGCSSRQCPGPLQPQAHHSHGSSAAATGSSCSGSPLAKRIER